MLLSLVMLCASANLLLIGTGMLDDDGVRDLQQRVNVVTVGYCVHRQVCPLLREWSSGKVGCLLRCFNVSKGQLGCVNVLSNVPIPFFREEESEDSIFLAL